MLGNDRLGGVLKFETQPHAQVPHHLARVLDVFQHTGQTVALETKTRKNSLHETNIAPENGWFEDDISFWDGPF